MSEEEIPKERKRLLLEEWLRIENNYLRIANNHLRRQLIAQDTVEADEEGKELVAAFEGYRKELSVKYGMEITPKSIDKERYLIEEPVAEEPKST